MRSLIVIAFCLLLLNQGHTQLTAVRISPSMIDPADSVIRLGGTDGWFFKKGNDTAFARNDADTSTWQKLNPVGLTENMADENGKLEGWFRIKVKLDTFFNDIPLELAMPFWAATDIYTDGVLTNRFGNTGSNGQPFKENRFRYQLSVPIRLENAKEHIFTIHFVDYISSHPPRQLRSRGSLGEFFTLALPANRTIVFNQVSENRFYPTLAACVNIILCLFFWLLALHNRSEKELFYIAGVTTIFSGMTICALLSQQAQVSFAFSSSLIFINNLMISFAIISSLLLIVTIFKQKISLLLIGLLLMVLVSGFNSLLFNIPNIGVFRAVVTIGIALYYIINSRKTLGGAQWVVVSGVLIPPVCALLINMPNVHWSKPSYIGLVAGIDLSFPLSLLSYVSLRFREFIQEVKDNAQQVIQLSEEKKLQAMNQQKILEEEVARQTIEIRTSLSNLQSTQAQLIQSEKMASLGELTAGIAHEIQNPLNFVNNFSEVNKELIVELVGEADKGNTEEVKAIANDIKDNSEKINHHGKRADAIVKGMLQHSRATGGQKEPTDINALCDEYLRLAYHGLRAKDKSFNATIKTEFDNSIGKISIIPQDMGRVLLNLYNNAFYAVNEKAKQKVPGFEPTVTIRTKRIVDKIQIVVEDNGNGISQNIIDKIFQPFFTTKPTGQGTGLGLSLAYDIVKAQNGSIEVDSKAEEFTIFKVYLSV